MTALTTNEKTRDDRLVGETEHTEVADGDKIFKSAHCALKGPNNADAAEAGRIGPYTGAKGETYMGEMVGLHDPSVDGSYGAAPTDDVTGDGSRSTALSWKSRILEKQTITLTDEGDQGKLVYLQDDNTYSLTPQTRPEPIGEVRLFRSTSSGDILVYGYGERRAKAGIRRIWLHPAGAVSVTGTTGDVVTGYPMPFYGHILALGYQVVAAITGTPDTNLSAELNGVDVTNGGVAIAVASANAYAVGTSFASGADSYFSRGDLLDIEISGSTGASAGTVFPFVDVMELAGS